MPCAPDEAPASIDVCLYAAPCGERTVCRGLAPDDAGVLVEREPPAVAVEDEDSGGQSSGRDRDVARPVR